MNFLQKNLAALEKYQPELARALANLSFDRTPQLQDLPDDIPDKLDALIVTGLPAPAAWARIDRARPAIIGVAEDDLASIRGYLGALDLEARIASGRLMFAAEARGVLQLLNDLYGTFRRRRVTVFGRQDDPVYARAVDEMRFHETLCSSNQATLNEFALIWQTHVCLNLNDYIRGPFFTDAAGRLEGREAVIVAAGPSLDDADLPGALGGATVICCDTAAPVLAARGILPDLIVTLDASVSNKAYLENLPREFYEQVTLAATPLVAHDVYAPFKNVLFYSYGHPLLNHLNKHGLPFEPVATGGSVALTAIDMADRMKARAIYLLGMDLDHDPARTHARGTGPQARAAGQVSRFLTTEMVSRSGMFEPLADEKNRTIRAKMKKWNDWLALHQQTHQLNLFRVYNRGNLTHIPVKLPAPGAGQKPDLRGRTRDIPAPLLRDLRFLGKEFEMAAGVLSDTARPSAEIVRDLMKFQRAAACLEYILAWLIDRTDTREAWQQVRALCADFAKTLQRGEAR